MSKTMSGPEGAAYYHELMEQRMTTMEAENARYAAVKDHPVAGPILEALHQQDARTYHGNSGDSPALAIATASLIEPVIRRDERQRIATLLEEHHATLADFPKSPQAMLDTIVFLLRLDHDAPAPARYEPRVEDAVHD